MKDLHPYRDDEYIFNWAKADRLRVRIRILEAELAASRTEHLKTREQYMQLIHEVQALKIEHGVNCRKAPHVKSIGYLHAENDDSPYDVDGVTYCGRCHVYLPMENFKA